MKRMFCGTILIFASSFGVRAMDSTSESQVQHQETPEVLAYRYFHGVGIPQDKQKAIEIWKKEAEKGDSWAQSQLASRYRDGDGVERDLEKAISLFRQSKTFWLISYLAKDFLGGHGVEKDIPKGLALLRECAENNCIYALAILSKCHFDGFYVTKDSDLGIRLLQDAANLSLDLRNQILGRNDVVSKWPNEPIQELADRYAEGNSVKKDIKKAVDLWKKAIRDDDFFGVYCIGDRCENLSKKTADLMEKQCLLHHAFELYASAAECDWPTEAKKTTIEKAMRAIFQLIESNKVICDKNLSARMVKILEKNVNQAILGEEFVYYLGIAYLLGVGVEQNIEIATGLFNKAPNYGNNNVDILRKRASAGDINAQYRLSDFYRNEGNGFSARYWCVKAALGGHQTAKESHYYKEFLQNNSLQ